MYKWFRYSSFFSNFFEVTFMGKVPLSYPFSAKSDATKPSLKRAEGVIGACAINVASSRYIDNCVCNFVNYFTK